MFMLFFVRFGSANTSIRSIWIQKCVVMSIIQNLLKGLELYKTLAFYWAALAITFSASVIMCFAECHPFSNYWTVVPDPGKLPMYP